MVKGMVSKNKRAQVFSIDLIVGILAFIFIMIAGIWMWDYSRERMYLVESRADLEILSRNALNVLVQTPGNPSNWTNIAEDDFNESNVKSLGLARSISDNNLDVEEKGRSAGLIKNGYLILDSNKVDTFNTLSSSKYDTYKRLLGILGPNYHFQLKIKQWNGVTYSTSHQIGGTPSSLALNIVRKDRFALMNDTWTNIAFLVWQECHGPVC